MSISKLHCSSQEKKLKESIYLKQLLFINI